MQVKLAVGQSTNIFLCSHYYINYYCYHGEIERQYVESVVVTTNPMQNKFHSYRVLTLIINTTKDYKEVVKFV